MSADRTPEQVKALQDLVKRGQISAIEAAAGPIINCAKINKSRKRAPRFEPPEQIDMVDDFGWVVHA